MEVLRMTLKDDSLENMRTVLTQDFVCDGINSKTVFAMRMKLIHAMAAIEPPKLIGVIQMDESFVRESQKGRNLERHRQPWLLCLQGGIPGVSHAGYCH